MPALNGSSAIFQFGTVRALLQRIAHMPRRCKWPCASSPSIRPLPFSKHHSSPTSSINRPAATQEDLVSAHWRRQTFKHGLWNRLRSLPIHGMSMKVLVREHPACFLPFAVRLRAIGRREAAEVGRFGEGNGSDRSHLMDSLIRRWR